MWTLDLIAHPIRAAIVRVLGRREAASLPELAEAVGAHRNTVRPHVAALEDAGAVVATRDEPRGRGRPALRYRLEPDWMPPTVDLRGLAELLAAALALSEIDRDKLAALGREWGRYLLGRPGTGRADEQLPGVLARLGFSADVRDDAVRLSTCPCPLVSPSRPELICALAGFVVDGALAGAADDRRVVGRANNHQRRRCTITLAMASDAP